MMRRALVAVALVLAARVATADDKARSRDGSGSGGHASDAGSRHHAGSASSSGADRGSGSAAGASASGDLTPAQQRHPRAGTGTGDRLGRFHYGRYGRPYSYRSYYYAGYGFYPYDSFYYFGYPRYFYSGYYGYDPYYARRQGYGYGYRDTGSLRVMVDPEKTRVYVDGYYAGIADDFDGIFQRLHISPGRHEITLKLEGYRTHRFRVYVPVDHTIKLHYDMVRGSGDDAEEVVGQPDLVGRPAGYARLEDEDDAWREADVRGDAGTLRLDVRPRDASIYVDGAFRGTARDLDRLRLTPGRHHIEMVRPGYRTVERDVEIRPGETSDLRADLDRS